MGNLKDVTVAIGIISILLAVIFFINWIGMLLWAYLAPMFNLPILSFWQFVGLNMLTHLLFANGFSTASNYWKKD